MANRSTMISDSDPMEKDNSMEKDNPIKKGIPMEKRNSIEREYSKEKGKSTEKEFPTKKKQPGEDVPRHKEEKGREKRRQDGEQKHRSAERGGKRRLRVYRGGSWERYPVPQLRLEGKWLEDYGFLPGTPIEVSCAKDQLIICKAPTISVLVTGSRSISAFDLSPYIPRDCGRILCYREKGIGSVAEQYARYHKIHVETAEPDGKQNGEQNGQGEISEQDIQMVSMADLVVAVWDGKSRGTKEIADHARKTGKPVKVITVTME